MFMFYHLYKHTDTLPDWGVALLLMVSLVGVVSLICLVVGSYIQDRREDRKHGDRRTKL